MNPNLYLNLEDDVSTIVEKVKKLRSNSLVLVCPKRCFLFNDGINLKLLKKQLDILGKEVFILTMDEKGQAYAKEAGFQLKALPGSQTSSRFSDIKVQPSKINTGRQQNTEPVFETYKEEKGKVFAENRHNKIVEDIFTKPDIQIFNAEFPSEIKKAFEFKKQKRSNKKITAVIFIFSLLVVMAVFLLVIPKADVIVYPKTEPITRDMEISLGTSVKAPDSSRLVLPAQKFAESMEASGTFQSQGKKEVGSKASGTVKIYNFTKKPLNLKAQTTTLTIGTKNYFLTSDVDSLKPTIFKNVKTKEVNTASLGASFEIVGEAGGESYNLPQGTRIEISNKVFGSNPLTLYAITDSPVSGGVSRFLSVITEQDIANSQESLGNTLLSKAREKLLLKNLTIADKAYAIESADFKADKPANAESPSFGASLKANITGLAFNSDELKKLVNDRISQSLSAGKKLGPENAGVLTYKIKSLDLNGETGVLLVHFEGESVSEINIADLAKQLKGKNKTEVSKILAIRPEIEKIDITLAPSWQKMFPWFESKIFVKEPTE
jgi:hypothetical protein